MLLLSLLLANAVCTAVQPYNIEVREIYPVYLRNGGVVESNGNSTEPAAYAAYSFDASSASQETKILVGQPKDGVIDSNTSVGAIYYCNVSFEKVESSGEFSDKSTARSSGKDMSAAKAAAGHGAMQSEYLTAQCENVTIFDPTERQDIGAFHKMGNDALGLHLTSINGTDEYVVCAPGRQRECIGQRNTISSPGACYYGNPDTNTWNFMKWNEPKCFDNIIDMIFLVDGSTSIGSDDFKLIQNWLVDMIRDLIETYGDAIRTEVLQYSTKDTFARINITDVFDIPYVLNDVLEMDEIEARIQNMKHLTGRTDTAYALKRASEWEFVQSTAYKESIKIVVVLTDGSATDHPFLSGWWKTYGATGKIISYAIGVGDYESYFYNQLELIANGGTSKDRVLTVESFEDLQSVLSNLTKSIATVAPVEGQSQNLASSDQSNRQIGSSITTLKDGTLHMGTIGMYLDSGGVMRFDDALDESPDVPAYDVIAKALPERTRDSYLGYATVSGFFNGESQGEFIAASAPRYKMKGAVVIYKPVQNSSYFVDTVTIYPPNDDRDQVAAYFGGCLLSVDVSGDGIDDLFVASPLFVADQYDEGLVSVYIGIHGKSTTEWSQSDYSPVELNGDNTVGSRFGSAMAIAGDLNLDGFQDVIIGAPLADEGKGAVFIYHGGGENGINSRPSQKIFASKFNGSSLQYFGQSLQGDIDVDGNSYPDIIVGAPKSDSLVLLKSRPILTITPILRFLNPYIDLFRCIDNGYKDCATLELCFIANGTSVEGTIEMKYTLSVDSEMNSGSRMVFDNNETSSTITNNNILLPTGRLYCLNYTLDLLKSASDFTSLVEAKVHFNLSDEHKSVPMSSVIDPLTKRSNYAFIKWEKGCEAAACVPDLAVTGNIVIPKFYSDVYSGEGSGEIPTDILVISTVTDGKPVTMTINFTNDGENSFDTKLTMTYPTNISLSSIADVTGSSPASTAACVEDDGVPSTIDGMTQQYFRYVHDGNVMRPQSWCQFQLVAYTEALRIESSLESFDIKFYINSTQSPENASTLKNNTWQRSIPIKYESNLAVRSEQGDTDITFNYTANDVFNITSVQDIGNHTPDVNVDIKVTANGYSNIPLSNIEFSYPWLIEDRHPLLYLYKLECFSISGETSCSCDTSSLNRYNLSDGTSGQTGNGTSKGNVEVTPLSKIPSGQEIVCPRNESDLNYICDTITCTVHDLYPPGEVRFRASFRLWTESIKGMVYNNTNIVSLDLKSNFKISTENSPLLIGLDGERISAKNQEVVVRAHPFVSDTVNNTEENVVLYAALGAVGGVLFLGIVAFLLWKFKFFESKYAYELKAKQEVESELNMSQASDETDGKGVENENVEETQPTQSDYESPGESSLVVEVNQQGSGFEGSYVNVGKEDDKHQ